MLSNEYLQSLSYRIQDLIAVMKSNNIKYSLDDNTKDIIEFNSLLKALELGLITKEDIEQNELYIKFKKRNNIGNVYKKKLF